MFTWRVPPSAAFSSTDDANDEGFGPLVAVPLPEGTSRVPGASVLTSVYGHVWHDRLRQSLQGASNCRNQSTSSSSAVQWLGRLSN